jgi:hypothetical protein
MQIIIHSLDIIPFGIYFPSAPLFTYTAYNLPQSSRNGGIPLSNPMEKMILPLYPFVTDPTEK